MGWFGGKSETRSAGESGPAYAPVLHCSFCGKSQQEVTKLIAGQAVYICDECVQICVDIIQDEVPEPEPEPEPTVYRPDPPPTPAELRAHLDAGCVGQAQAKRALVTAMSLHLARLTDDSALRPPVVLLVGPRGAGKTTLCRALTQATPLPSYLGDVSRLSASGYVGLDVENLLFELTREVGEDWALAQEGLLLVDGLHRITLQTAPVGAPRDISGESVQRELVRVLEGATTEVSSERMRHPQVVARPFSCARLLVVLTATWEGLPQGERAQREALRADGLVGELLSRVDSIVEVGALDREELHQVLTRDQGLLPVQLASLASLGREVHVEPDAVELMVEAAADHPDGAWALRAPLARLAREAMDREGGWRVSADVVRSWGL